MNRPSNKFKRTKTPTNNINELKIFQNRNESNLIPIQKTTLRILRPQPTIIRHPNRVILQLQQLRNPKRKLQHRNDKPLGLIRSPQHRASATTKFFKACNRYENLNARPAGANYEKIKKFNNRAGNDEK